jgi:hypothetical protein
MLTALARRADVASAYETLAERLRHGAKRLRRPVNWPGGGGGQHTVLWHENEKFWVILRTHIRERYWIALGVQDPMRVYRMGVTCEINPPKKGIDRRCGGVFARRPGGGILLCHTGRVGGGGKGIGTQAFLEAYRGRTEKIEWPDGKITNVIVLGDIAAPSFLLVLERFIVDVDNFKKKVKIQLGIDEVVTNKQLQTAATEGAFDPLNLIDAREKTIASIVRRQGQPVFRKRLLKAYGRHCAISDCNCADALEAAHIRPYLGVGTNHPTNGILLRSDLHLLFDYHKISFDKDFRVLVSKALNGTVYEGLRGKRMKRPVDVTCSPNSDALEMHRAEMKD